MLQSAAVGGAVFLGSFSRLEPSMKEDVGNDMTLESCIPRVCYNRAVIEIANCI